MRKIIFSLIMILFPIPCFANPFQFLWQDESDKWNMQDSVLEGSYGLLYLIDGIYTVHNLKKDNIKELNIFSGEHPSTRKIFVYTSIFFIGHTGIAYMLPSKFRTIWQSIFIGVELTAIYRNFMVCTKYKF